MVAMDPKSLSHEELRLLYQVTVNDLTYFKAQQWSLTNYTFLLLASIVAAAQILKFSLAPWERYFLIALAATAAVGALIVLSKLQNSIRIRQARLEKIRDSFSSTFIQAWTAEVKSREFFHAIYFLRTAVALGAVVVCYLVYRL